MITGKTASILIWLKSKITFWHYLLLTLPMFVVALILLNTSTTLGLVVLIGMPALLLALACGVADAAANGLILTGLRLGELSVMSVLVALYPAGTIVLAAVVLKERIAPLQIVGLVLAIAAAGMLSLA
jgi:drug/metabolite transporter (DMT)-like permease